MELKQAMQEKNAAIMGFQDKNPVVARTALKKSSHWPTVRHRR